jgi:Tol biopolymer transport system component
LFIYDRDTASTERIPLGRSQGLGADYTLALSADGRFVAYSYHIYDRTTGQTTDMPTTDGERPNGPVFAPRFAGNGNFLAFVSRAGNLVAGDTNEVHDVFVWNRETNEVERVSVATGNSEGNDSSGAFQFHEGTGSDLAYSEDGRFVAFSSLATNLTSDLVNECDDYRGYSRACYNLFLHERESDETRLITRGANQDSSSPALSADGRFLTFASLATSFTDDILPECPFPAMVNCGQIYLYEGQIDKFSLISRGINGQTGNQGSWQPVVSGDGRFITFVSSADNLVSGDTNNASDIFVFDQQTKQIERVSLTHTAD